MIKTVETISRIDQLIRLQATGTPKSLALRLGISKAKLYRIIDLMKQLNAPVTYNTTAQSFVYKKSVGFTIGFYATEDTIKSN